MKENRKKKFLGWCGGFFAVMLFFSIVSRAAASVNVAQIQTGTIQNQVIRHEVRGNGRVEGAGERAVFVRENQKVARIYVEEGQSVKKGEPLLKLSVRHLREAVRQKENEILELRLELEDIQSAKRLSDKKRFYAKKRAEENYEMAAGRGNASVAGAEAEADAARRRLREYYASQEPAFTDRAETDLQEQALKDDIRRAEEQAAQAALGRKQELIMAGREIEDAGMGEAADSTVVNRSRELHEAEQELLELQKLLEKKGKVVSPVNGVVKALLVTTGGGTTTDGAALLYETGGGLRMEGTIGKEDLPYAEIGGRVRLKGADGKETEGILRSVRASDAGENFRSIFVELKEEAFAIGESVEFTVSKETGPYSACVPLSALGEENGACFVYVVDRQDTVLGEALTARKVSVTLKDKNSETAALGDGVLAGQQKVIVYSDREIRDGSHVRLQEN